MEACDCSLRSLALVVLCDPALMCVTSAGYDPIPTLRVGLDGDPGYILLPCSGGMMAYLVPP